MNLLTRPLLALLILAPWHLSPAAQPPNIVLVMCDDLGWGDVGFNGNKIIKTPELDAMAADGLKFNRFYAAAPVCSPARGSVVTGRHPFRYGIYFANTGHMKPREITLAELLKTKGYRTGHFGESGIVSPARSAERLEFHELTISHVPSRLPERLSNRPRTLMPYFVERHVGVTASDSVGLFAEGIARGCRGRYEIGSASNSVGA